MITNGDEFLTDDIDNRVAKLFLFDFKQSGIHLTAEKVCVIFILGHIYIIHK